MNISSSNGTGMDIPYSVDPYEANTYLLLSSLRCSGSGSFCRGCIRRLFTCQGGKSMRQNTRQKNDVLSCGRATVWECTITKMPVQTISSTIAKREQRETHLGHFLGCSLCPLGGKSLVGSLFGSSGLFGIRRGEGLVQ